MEATRKFKYIIVGAGLSGAQAIVGIRELDSSGSILLIGQEDDLPYHRPPLTKDLWSGKKKIEDIFIKDREFYANNGVTLLLGTEVKRIDPQAKTVSDDKKKTYCYEKLLLATGGKPRMLSVPGGNGKGICYYRYLKDYKRIKAHSGQGKKAVVIGGGFIGSEIAAALSMNKIKVTMIFPEDYIAQRIFPASLGRDIQNRFLDKGIEILNKDEPGFIIQNGTSMTVRTLKGRAVACDMMIAGIGVVPDTALAADAGLKVANGIDVNEYLQTSHPDIYAAGDNAFFPYKEFHQSMRFEHWDNAVHQGLCAGRNMAQASRTYDHMPYFFSDLFEFGYEAVGDIDSRLETFADWQKTNDTGVVYYLKDNQVQGVMMCNTWDKVDRARALIKKAEKIQDRKFVL